MLNDESINEQLPIKNKKGRPRKIPIPVELVGEIQTEPEKKKRGRKKKEKVEEEVKIKKKRGRKAALKFFSSTIRKRIPLTTVIHDSDKSILHLEIKNDDSETQKRITYDALKAELGYNIQSNDDDDILSEYIDKIESNDNEIDNEIDIKDLYEKRLESRLIQDNNLIKNFESLYIKSGQEYDGLSKLINKTIEEDNTLIKDEDEDRKNGYFSILHKFISSKDWIDNTDVCCWWCCHTFSSIPIGLPVSYSKSKFRVKGVFCSFACMLSYNPINSQSEKSMINNLYTKLTGGIASNIKDSYINDLNYSCKIKNLFNETEEDKILQKEYVKSMSSMVHNPLEKAPPRCSLKMFGGRLNIEEFRNSTKERKVYKMIEYPMYISRDFIEEVDLDNLKKVNKNVFSKKNGIVSNALDTKKLEEVKNRMNSTVSVSDNSMDKFLRF